MTTAAAPERPRLRGWIHAAAAPLAAFGLWPLLQAVAPGTPARMSVTVFGICLVGLYTVSAVYHVPNWSPRVRWLLSRADVAMIVLFIAGTFTPVAFHALQGTWRTASLVIAWSIALIGAGIAVSPVRGPRWLSVASYLALGWILVIPLVRVLTAVPWEGIGLFALGGALYTVGAVVYLFQRPNPLPRWLGYHEIFHLLVVAGSTAHYLAIWRYVLPIAGG